MLVQDRLWGACFGNDVRFSKNRLETAKNRFSGFLRFFHPKIIKFSLLDPFWGSKVPRKLIWYVFKCPNVPGTYFDTINHPWCTWFSEKPPVFAQKWLKNAQKITFLGFSLGFLPRHDTLMWFDCFQAFPNALRWMLSNFYSIEYA